MEADVGTVVVCTSDMSDTEDKVPLLGGRGGAASS